MRTSGRLEERVQDLEVEVDELRAENRRLWRVVGELRVAIQGEDHRSDSQSYTDSRSVGPGLPHPMGG